MSGGSTATGGSRAQQSKVMLPPINLIFKHLQQQTVVNIWLYEQTATRIQGKIKGFDEFMNVVVDEAVELNIAKDTRRRLGRILLKGDNITLIGEAGEAGVAGDV